MPSGKELVNFSVATIKESAMQDVCVIISPRIAFLPLARSRLRHGVKCVELTIRSQKRYLVELKISYITNIMGYWMGGSGPVSIPKFNPSI